MTTRNLNGIMGLGVIAILLTVVFLTARADTRQKSEATALADAIHIAQVAVKEAADLKRRYDLSIEFGFNPIIVEIVDNESREAFKTAKGDEFRLIQTHEYLTHIFLSMIYTESKGVIDARGDKGKAYGLTQIWLGTARDYFEVEPHELYDPQINVRVSMLHFRYLLTEYRGNFTLALLAWNRGKATVDNMIAWGKSPANGYGARVFNASVTATRYNLAVRR